MSSASEGVHISLAGKVLLVTGASQGIGASIARMIHEAGADVIINHPAVGTSTADADKLAAELNSIRC